MEGYLKFRCTREDEESISAEEIVEINKLRSLLKKPEFNLIGECSVLLDPEKGAEIVGFGNISKRGKDTGTFLISGTRTGGVLNMGPEHYVLVTSYNISKNTLHCKGRVDASAESFSHAAVYEAREDARLVVHIHHLDLWNAIMRSKKYTDAAEIFPVSSVSAKYGTPEIAFDIKQELQKPENKSYKFLLMGGHVEGLLFFGPNPEEIKNTMAAVFNKYLGWPKEKWQL